MGKRKEAAPLLKYGLALMELWSIDKYGPVEKMMNSELFYSAHLFPTNVENTYT